MPVITHPTFEQQPEHISRGRSERPAQPDFSPSLRDDVNHDAKDAHDRKAECNRREQPHQQCSESRRCHVLGHQGFHCRELHRHVRRNLVGFTPNRFRESCQVDGGSHDEAERIAVGAHARASVRIAVAANAGLLRSARTA